MFFFIDSTLGGKVFFILRSKIKNTFLKERGSNAGKFVFKKTGE
jgi:hypothetical protein